MSTCDQYYWLESLDLLAFHVYCYSASASINNNYFARIKKRKEKKMKMKMTRDVIDCCKITTVPNQTIFPGKIIRIQPLGQLSSC